EFTVNINLTTTISNLKSDWCWAVKETLAIGYRTS
nr:hypothetical protein [Tanacetum cinerariifolium]